MKFFNPFKLIVLPTPIWVTVACLAFMASIAGAASPTYTGSLAVSAGGTITDPNQAASQCAEYNASHQLVSTGAACDTAGGTLTGITAGSNIVVSPSGAPTPTVAVTNAPSFTGPVTTTSSTGFILPQNGIIGNNIAGPNIIKFGTSGQGTYFDLYRPTSGTTDIDTSGAAVGTISGTAIAIQTLGGSALAALDTSGNWSVAAGLFGTSVTDSGLTSGDCVQGSTGGLLASAASACPILGANTFTATQTISAATPLTFSNTTTNTINSASAGAQTPFVFNASNASAPTGPLALFSVNGTNVARVSEFGGLCPGNGVANSPQSACFYTGSGAPTLSAPTGSLYTNYNAANAETVMYVNNSGASTSGTSWLAVPASSGVGYAISTFTSSGTFTTAANSSAYTVYHFRIVGGGGGGGGAEGAASSSAGGGAGAYTEGSFTGIAASTGVTVTVGSGGTAGTSTGGNGGGGGASSIGTPVSVSCNGGSGGAGSTAATPTLAAGGAGGLACTGTTAFTQAGTYGGAGYYLTAISQPMSGAGGGSAFGPAGQSGGINGNLTGIPGVTTAYGAGGSGGYSGGSGVAGAAGGGGIVIIERMTP